MICQHEAVLKLVLGARDDLSTKSNCTDSSPQASSAGNLSNFEKSPILLNPEQDNSSTTFMNCKECGTIILNVSYFSLFCHYGV